MAKENNKFKIVCISDTHNQHRKLDPLPEGDLLISAGDFSVFGREEHIADFDAWLGEQTQFRARVVVPGNHEQPKISLKQQKPLHTLVAQGLLLSQSAAEIDGLRVFGTQFCWPRPMWEYHEKWAEIPEGTHVLVTHGPPEGFLDGGIGCGALARAIKKIRPKLVIFGHVHHAHGIVEGTGEFEGITFVNAAICGGESYAKKYDPIVVKIEF